MKVDKNQRLDGLPTVPLSNSDLQPLADRAEIEAVWVPSSRPASVETRAGVHDGDILDFYIETREAYYPVRYTSPEDTDAGLAWYRAVISTGKDEPICDLVEETLASDYYRLEEE